MVWVVLLKFPLFLHEVLCAALPLQLLSEDSRAAYLVIKDRHFLGVALPVPGRALLELAIATDLAGNPLGCFLLVVVLTLLHEQCFAVPLILQEGLMDESLGLAVLLSRELLLVQVLLLKFPLVLHEVLCATLPLHLLSEDLLAANLLFKDRLFSGVSLYVPGRALLEVAIAGGLVGNALG